MDRAITATTVSTRLTKWSITANFTHCALPCNKQPISSISVFANIGILYFEEHEQVYKIIRIETPKLLEASTCFDTVRVIFREHVNLYMKQRCSRKLAKVLVFFFLL